MNIIFQDTLSKLQHALVDDLTTYFIAHREKPLLLLYSGGSALDIFPLFAEQLKNVNFMGKDVWFAPVDERFDVTVSNYRALAALQCFSELERLGFRFVDILEHGDSLENAAYWYNGWIRAEMDRVHMNEGKIVSILGMGPDGHTAGIFPFPENETFFEGEFIDTSRYVTGYDVGDKNPYRERITVTISALKVTDASFVYVSGTNKKDALQRVVKSEGSLAATPAQIWNELNTVNLYTDISL